MSQRAVAPVSLSRSLARSLSVCLCLCVSLSLSPSGPSSPHVLRVLSIECVCACVLAGEGGERAWGGMGRGRAGRGGRESGGYKGDKEGGCYLFRSWNPGRHTAVAMLLVDMSSIKKTR